MSPPYVHLLSLHIYPILPHPIPLTPLTFQSIQDEFVNSRSEAATTGTKDILTETDLTRRLLFARILCASHGVEELTLDIWSQATDLDAQRTSRLPPTPQASA
jgi:hypothetical protein